MTRLFTSYAPEKCASCGNSLCGECGLSLIKCGCCSALRPVSSSPPDYFSLFCIPATFNINAANLRHQYLKMQRLLHPDNYPKADDVVKSNSERWSALLNKAFETLKDPHRRAIYLYKLGSGRDFNEETTLEQSKDSPEMAEMLAEVMELRLALEDYTEPGEVKAMMSENGERIDRVLEKIKEAYSQRDWNRLRELLIQLRYWKSIDEAAQNILEELM